jgi:protein O-GlcNAc transferase
VAELVRLVEAGRRAGDMTAIRQTLLDAAEHHRAGRLAAAESGYRAVLDALPQQADALHLLGVLCHQSGRHAEAIALIERAIAVDEACADFYSNLGEARRALGEFAAAEVEYRRALALRPDSAGALTNLGLVLCELKRPTEAAECLRQAIALAPDLAEAHDNLGLALQALEDFDGAVASHSRAVALKPGYAKAHNNLGSAHLARDEVRAAITCYKQALALEPDYPQAHYNLANIQTARDELGAARAGYERALALKPGYFDASLNLAALLDRLGESDRAVELLSGLAAAHPDSALVHTALGGTLSNRTDFAAGEIAFREGIALAPDKLDSWSSFLFFHHYRNDRSSAQIRAVNAAFDAALGAPLRSTWQAHDNDRTPERRLRVGYVSPDFRAHSCSFFIAPLLAAHDRAQVELFAYANGDKSDDVTARLKASVDHWRPITKYKDDAVADAVRADGIDILVDLAGHTAGSRLGLFARKPAPVQTTWLGYPGSTGLSAIDYRLTDAVADPPGADVDAVERLVRLPYGFLCYEPPADMPAISPLPARSAGAITFGCFNNAIKISAETIALWARVLQVTPGSRLLIKAFSIDRGNNLQRLRRLLAECDVPAECVDLRVQYGAARSHFATYAEVDVALDPFPYNGTTTTCEALWLGVPTLTLRGDRHAGRVGASLMTTVGLPEMIAETAEDYVRKAAALAADIDGLAALRAGLRERMRASRLTDAAQFARSVEAAYRDMWRRWCAGP